MGAVKLHMPEICCTGKHASMLITSGLDWAVGIPCKHLLSRLSYVVLQCTFSTCVGHTAGKYALCMLDSWW